MAVPLLERTTFHTSRALDFFTITELQRQTGQPGDCFARVVTKELLDNALDAAEAAGVAPEVAVQWRQEPEAEVTWIAVTDNGPGIPPDTAVKSLDFLRRTTDKAHYRAPTRGAQGNALQTILGMPCALAGDREVPPVIICGRGVRHEIRVEIDPAGEPRVDYRQAAWSGAGTHVEVPLPWQYDPHDGCPGLTPWEMPLDLLFGFRVANPHLKMTLSGETAHIISPTAAFPGDWRKFLPTDATSAWWYGREHLERLVFAHIADNQNGGRDLPLRDFVRQFRGLSSTAKAKAICEQFPGIRHLSDLVERREAIAGLLAALQAGAAAPRPDALGEIGEAHLRAAIDALHTITGGFDYRKARGEAAGLPYVLEVAVADAEDSAVHACLNFSPTYSDPFAGHLLKTEAAQQYGLGILRPLHCRPYGDGPGCAVVVHLACPGLAFQDRGKARVALPRELVQVLQDTLWKACNRRYRQVEREKRRMRSEERAAAEERGPAPRTLKEAVFAVMEAAAAKASGGGRFVFPLRNLYYAARPAIQEHTDKPLDYTYFSQTLVTEWEERRGPIPGLYRDPRGYLYEPHSGQEVALGTREVDDYQLPDWRYDKVLYVEKKGLWPILQAAHLAEKYDMAVIAAEGYATRAARTLLQRAEQDRAMTILCLHDADPAGYNIARTLQEATRSMPGHSVEVIDLGLRIEEALQMGLQEEVFTRDRALPSALDLTGFERECFEGKRVWTGEKRQWQCRRVELNAFDPDPLIGYIERKLEEHGCARKLVPPAAVVTAAATEARTQALEQVARRHLEDLIDMDRLVAALAGELEDRVDIADVPAFLLDWAGHLPAQSWKTRVGSLVEERVDSFSQDLRERALVKIRDAMQHGNHG